MQGKVGEIMEIYIMKLMEIVDGNDYIVIKI
jgi:hypothetical protein